MKARAFLRIVCRSHADAKELALRLEADGYGAVRRWKSVIACSETHEEAEQLALKLRLHLCPDGSLIWTRGREPGSQSSAIAEAPTPVTRAATARALT
jgi:hypothetical protein